MIRRFAQVDPFFGVEYTGYCLRKIRFRPIYDNAQALANWQVLWIPKSLAARGCVAVRIYGQAETRLSAFNAEFRRPLLVHGTHTKSTPARATAKGRPKKPRFATSDNVSYVRLDLDFYLGFCGFANPPWFCSTRDDRSPDRRRPVLHLL